MPKKVSYKEGGGGGYFKAPAGGHPAIIVGVMELGIESRDFQGDGKFRDFEEIRILYEIEAEQEIYDAEKEELTGKFEEKIGIIGQNYNDVISDKSNLGKVITAVYDVKSVKDIKDFSLDELLGQKCFIEVELKGRKGDYEIVTSVSGASKKIQFHEQETKNFYFGMEDPDDFIDFLEDDETKKFLKPWDLERLKASPEYKAYCKLNGIEVPEKLEDQEENMKEEAKERKEEQAKAEAEPTVSESNVAEVFTPEELPTEEPATQVKARANAKVKEEPLETANPAMSKTPVVEDDGFE